MGGMSITQDNPFDFYREHIAQGISHILGIPKDQVLPAIQRSQTLEKGDCVLATPALRLRGQTPTGIASSIQDQFPDSPFIHKPIRTGSFVQFFFKPISLAQRILTDIPRIGSDYGKRDEKGARDVHDFTQGRKTVVIDFGSPNIAKPFHAGHLRSTIIGGFLANLYEFCGWKVVRLNYLGDWGKQYGVLAIGYERFGIEELLEKDPVGHLFEVYVKISAVARDEKMRIDEMLRLSEEGNGSEMHGEVKELQEDGVDQKARDYFKRMCDGDVEALGLWKKFRDLSIVKYQQTFARLNIRYDEYWGESQVQEASMTKALQQLSDMGVSEESQGATIVDLTSHSKSLGKAIVRKKDGTSIYLTRDLGGVFEREEKYHFDKMIYVIASQQDLHVAQLIKIVELMGRKDLADKLQHINFGMVQGMSTRRGTVRFLDDILRDTGDKMHEVMRANEEKYQQVEDPEHTADVLGISAVLVQDMSGKRINGYTFDMNRMTSFEGDTGPYLQYAHARLCSIIRKADLVETNDLLEVDFSLLAEKPAQEIVRLLAQWHEVVELAYKTQEPVTILTYLFRLTHTLSSNYDHLNVIRSEEALKKARLALFISAKTVLGIGMRLLCLTPVERM